MRRAYLTLTGVCIGWGTIPLVVRRVALPAAAIVSARVWLAAAGLGVATIVDRRRPGPALLSVQRGRAFSAAAVLAVHWLALFAAYQRAPAGTVILVVYLAPVGIAACAPLVLGERIGRRAVAALGVALAGFALVTVPSVHRSSWPGLALAVAAAATFVALVVLSKPLAETYGGLRAAFIEMAGAGTLLVPVAVRTAWGHPRPVWLLLLVLGLVHTAAGTALYLGALARVPATHTGILGYLEPASVLVVGWLFLGERPSLTVWLGGMLIVAAGLAVMTAGSPDVPVSPLEVPAGAG